MRREKAVADLELDFNAGMPARDDSASRQQDGETENGLLGKLKGLSSAREPDASASTTDSADALRSDDPAALEVVVRGTGAANSRLVGDAAARRSLEESRLRRVLACRPIDVAALPAELDPESREHSAHIGPDGRVWKITRGDAYGLAPSEHFPRFLHGPAEYLDRLALQNAYFGDDVRVLGYAHTVGNPFALVTAQPFVESMVDARGRAMHPDMRQDIVPYMEARGWVMSRDGEVDYSWFHPDGVVVRDVRPRNFILQPDGSVVPIDVMMTRLPEREDEVVADSPDNRILGAM